MAGYEAANSVAAFPVPDGISSKMQPESPPGPIRSSLPGTVDRRQPRAELIRVRRGPTSGLEEYIGEWFGADTARVEVRDPYLRRPHQLDNLRQLVRIVQRRCHPSTGTPVSISVLTTAPHEHEEDDIRRQREALSHIQETSADVDFRFRTLPPGHSDYNFHDREIRLTAQDGRQTSILLGRGLDFIRPASAHKHAVPMAVPTYIAVFQE